MPHEGHHHISAEAGDRRVAAAVVVNLGLGIAQILGGIIAGSVALIADAVHNLTDAFSLILAYVARRIARRPADLDMTFGYGRAEAIAALVNYTLLVVAALWLGFEAVQRLFDPPAVMGWVVVALAGLSLAVDLGTVLLTWGLARTSVNIRAAMIHNLTDAATSLTVIGAGALIILFDWRLVDPLVTLAISGWILWLSLKELRPVIRLLMLASPPGLDAGMVLASVRQIPGVSDARHLHLWQIDEHRNAVEVHVRIDPAAETGATVRRIEDMLARDFGLDHAAVAIGTPPEGG